MTKSVIAAALAATALVPAAASAQDGQQQWRGHERGERPAPPQGQAAPQGRPQVQPGGFEGRRFGDRGPAPAAPAAQPQAQPRFEQGGFVGRRFGDQFQPRQPQAGYAQPRPVQPGWDGQRRFEGQPGVARAPQPVPPARGYAPQGFARQGYAPQRGYGFAQPGYRNGYANGWNRGWRNDSRFDWSGYRARNYEVFRLPRYAAPYGWSYGYRRFSIGVRLFEPLVAEDYWIDEPEYFRLPPAYGPYRWVRYYDDALLVDLDSGEVVDAVYGIFE